MPQDIEQAAQNQNGWQVYRRLAGLALQYRWPLGLALLGMLLSGMVSPLMAAYIEPLLDGTFVDKDPKVIAWAPWVLLMIFFIRGLSSYLTGYYMGYVGRSVVSSVRSGLFNKTLTAPLLTLDGQESGVHIGRMLYQAEQLSEAATKGLKILVQDSITVVGLLLWMTYISGQLTLIVLASVPLVALVIRFVTKRFRRISHHLQDSASQVGQVSSEVLQGSRDIRVYGGQSHEQTRFELANQNNRTAFLKRLRTDQISTPIVNFILGLALAGVIAYATRLNFSPGTFMSFMTAMLLLVDPTKRLSQVNASLQNGIAAGASIFQFIDAPDEEDKGTYHTARVKGDISIEQLHFAYPEKASVIKGLSLNIAAGEKIALVGQSGSGKTTLMQLLPRFYSLTQGSIKIDDVDVSEYRLSNLRAQFAYVGQDVQLFNASVKDNICYAAAYDEARMIEAAEKAHAHEFITQLTDGYQQAIGENGNSLSGGQKQRLALARAFYADAPILLLDEATSALDANSEERVQQALSELMQGRTTVMIAHRLSSIEGVDRIIVMEQGQIIEQGSHAALMAKKHAYYQLVQKQMAYVVPSAST